MTTEKRFTLRMNELVSDKLDDLWKIRGAASKNALINDILMVEIEKAIATKELPPLINANVITPEQRQQFEEVVELTTRLTGKNRSEVIASLFNVQSKALDEGVSDG